MFLPLLLRTTVLGIPWQCSGQDLALALQSLLGGTVIPQVLWPPQKKIRRKEERDILVMILLLLRRFDRVLSLEGYDGGG